MRSDGAGKSSIFRCLGGLWTIPHGSITKPGSADSGLDQEVFYLPQKPYNVLGTLFDQLTYPEQIGEGDTKLTKERLIEILDMVGLAYLAAREGVLDSEVNWEDECSLGEKQRLAIARLVYHQPRFAILDECVIAHLPVFVIPDILSGTPVLQVYKRSKLRDGARDVSDLSQ